MRTGPKALPLSIFLLSLIPPSHRAHSFSYVQWIDDPHGTIFTTDPSAKLMVPYLQYPRDYFHLVTLFLFSSPAFPPKFACPLTSKPQISQEYHYSPWYKYSKLRNSTGGTVYNICFNDFPLLSELCPKWVCVCLSFGFVFYNLTLSNLLGSSVSSSTTLGFSKSIKCANFFLHHVLGKHWCLRCSSPWLLLYPGLPHSHHQPNSLLIF